MTIDFIMSQEDAYRHAKNYLAFLGFGRIVEIEKVSADGQFSYYISSFNNNSYKKTLTVMSVNDFMHLIKNDLMLLDENVISVNCLFGDSDKFVVKKNIFKKKNKTEKRLVKRFTRIFKSV